MQNTDVLLYSKILYFSPDGTSLITTRPRCGNKRNDGSYAVTHAFTIVCEVTLVTTVSENVKVRTFMRDRAKNPSLKKSYKVVCQS